MVFSAAKIVKKASAQIKEIVCIVDFNEIIKKHK